MASSLSDVLRAVGFSELIDKIEDVDPLEETRDFLTDSERMKEFVAEEQLDDFIAKVEEFFELNNSIGNSQHSDSNDSLVNNVEEQNQENNDINNIGRNCQNTNSVFAIENVDIVKILDSTFEGKQILSWHQSKSFLTTGKRKRLVHFVIASILLECNRPLVSSDFKVLSKKIVEVFPYECETVYFDPCVTKSNSVTGRRRKAKGKLINKYNNLKKLQINFDKAKKPSKEQIENELSECELTDEIQTSIDWLQDNEDPWEDTLNHWRKTEEYRRTQIGDQILNKISSIYERWPILKCPRAYNLIKESFALGKFTEDSNCITKFKDFFSKALAVKPVPRDDQCKTLLAMLEDENLKEDDGNLVRLMLLCILLPSSARIPIGGKKRWKPSVVESFDGIVTKIKIHADIEKVKETRRQHARTKNLTVQPYLIVVEENDYDVHSVYLCIDDILYAIPSLLEGLDACFKSFHVLHANYTLQSEHIWTMLQLGLYKFRTKWDMSFVNVNEILQDMRCLPPIQN